MSLDATDNKNYSADIIAEKMELVSIEHFMQAFLQAYPTLEPKKLAQAFRRGMEKAAAPAGNATINFYEHYARPEQFARELARIIIGLPAFRQPLFDRLDLFLGLRKNTMSEKAYMQAMAPLIKLINRALASAQVVNEDTFNNPGLEQNYELLGKFDSRDPTLNVDPTPGVAPRRLNERTQELRKAVNSGLPGTADLGKRLCELEENIQAMVLAKRFFGRLGPYTMIPALQYPSDKNRILTFDPADQLAFLEDQMSHFQTQLNHFIRSRIQNRDSGIAFGPTLIASEIHDRTEQSLAAAMEYAKIDLHDSAADELAATAEELNSAKAPAVTLIAPDDYDQNGGKETLPRNRIPSAPPPSPQMVRKTEQYTALLGKLMKISNKISELQGGPNESGAIEKMRVEAEIAAGRAAEAQKVFGEAVQKIFEHRHSWLSITENSRVSALKQKCLHILEETQKRLTEIENGEPVEPQEWPEIAYSDNRASMPVDNIHNMTDELEQIIVNLRADACELEDQLYQAKKIRDNAVSQYKRITQKNSSLLSYLKTTEAKNLLEIYSAVKCLSE